MSEPHYNQHDDDRVQGKRHNSLERYRPGAFYSEERENSRRRENNEQPKPLPAEGEGGFDGGAQFRRGGKRGGGGGGWGRGRGRGGRGGGGGWGRGDDGAAAAEELEGQLEQMNLGQGDLRHRLNQRSRDPAPPPVNLKYANGDAEHRGGRGGGGGGRKNHSRLQGRGGMGGGNGTAAGRLPLPKRNTENFNPSHEPTEMRLLVAHPGLKKFNREYTSRDVLMVMDLFCEPEDLTIYDKLLAEIKNCGVDEDILWQSWHGDSHVIADDKKRWKEACPTFHWVVDKLADYFDMDIKATRLNW